MDAGPDPLGVSRHGALAAPPLSEIGASGLARAALAAPAVSVPRSTDVLSVETIDDAERLATLRDDWSALVESATTGTVFNTWEWLGTWWRHLSGPRRLSLIAVRLGPELVAVAPLALGTRRPSRLVPFRALEFLGTGSVGSDYLDVVVRRGRERIALEALGRHLGNQRFALELRQLRWPSSTVPALEGHLVERGWACLDRREDVCPFIDLRGHTWTSYLASLDGHHRNAFKRRLRNAMTAHTMRLDVATTERERRAALPTLIELHRRRWEHRGGSTAFHSPALRAFHEDFSAQAAARGWLRLFVLHLDGEPAAAIYGFRFGPRFYYYQTGFDPRCAHLGIGHVIVGLSIQAALEEGAEEYDFLHGDERYKFDWARQVHHLGRFEAYPPSLRGDLHRAAAALSHGVRTTAHRALGLLERPRDSGRHNGGHA